VVSKFDLELFWKNIGKNRKRKEKNNSEIRKG
jgi:hypothetical protein